MNQIDYTYNGKLRMPNGNWGPWRVISKVSPMKSVLVVNAKGKKDVVPVSQLRKIRGSEKSVQTTLFT